MNSVVNQLVKEAAYHAAKYDSTIQAINALAGNGMNKTAGASDSIDVLTGYLGNIANDAIKAQVGAEDVISGLKNPAIVDTLKSDLLGRFGDNAIVNAIRNFGTLTNSTDFLNNASGNPLISQPNSSGQFGAIANSMLPLNDNPFSAAAAHQAGVLANQAAYDGLKSRLSGAVSGALDQGSDILGILKKRFVDLPNQAYNPAPTPGVLSEMAGNLGASDLAGVLGVGAGAAGLGALAKSNSSAAQQAASQASQIDALKNQLSAAQSSNGSLLSNLGNRLRNAGSSAMEAIKNNPGTSAAIGAGAAGLAALPFLMGGEKEGSYNPYKLAALRNALANMR